MTIYLRKPQNAGEAIRRVAKAAGGNPLYCLENLTESHQKVVKGMLLGDIQTV